MGRETSICFSLMTTKFRSLLGFTTLRPRLVHEQKIMICEKFRHSLQVRGGMTRVMVTSHKSCPTLYPPHYHYPLILPENTPIIGYRHCPAKNLWLSCLCTVYSVYLFLHEYHILKADYLSVTCNIWKRGLHLGLQSTLCRHLRTDCQVWPMWNCWF